MIQALDAVRQPWLPALTASSLAGIRAGVAGGLGITVLGRSFIGPDMQALEVPAHWPALPRTEIVLIGEEQTAAEVARPLAGFLTESLASGASAAA